MIKDQGTEKFLESRNFSGWNVFDDSSSIADNELSEIKNAGYDAGFISPLKGSSLLTTKPSGETGDPLQIIVAKQSDGNEYLIAIYANHFYLWHDDNEEWVKINQSFTPAETTLRYGWVNWNNGRGDDRLYACNGVDSVIRWNICVTTASGTNSSGSSTFTVSDATRFPNTGTLVIKNNGTEFTEPYTSKSGNTFNLTNTLNEDVIDGASVTLDIIEKSSMEIGKILVKHQSRLFVMNYYGGETTVWYSKLSLPEDFTTATSIAGAGTEVISDGNGEITAAHDFGEFLVIEKEDSIHSFKFVVSSDLGSKLTQIVPILSGQSVGTISQEATVKIQNTLMYPSKTEGFLAAIPTLSGTNTGVKLDVLSKKIQSYVKQAVSYGECKGIVHDNKALWAVAQLGGSQNTIVLIYDFLRASWTKIERRWAVQDWGSKDGKLYYLDNSTGSIYEAFTLGYNDNNNPYLVEFFTKRNDFGIMAKPKYQDLIYVQGYMTPMTDLFIDVLFNESGDLQKQTFRLNKDTENLLISDPITDEAGNLIPGNVILGWVAYEHIGNISFFRGYLGINVSNGYYNLQCRVYQNKSAFFGITGMAHNPKEGDIVPDEMVISPI